MPDNEDGRADLRHAFQAAISDALTGRTAGDGEAPPRGARPDLRRPPLDEVAIFRVRVDLTDAEPPIWRRVDLRSDLPLDAVHQVLQVAFDWADSHLHRFSLGGHPFDRTSQLFLCPYDAEEGDFDDEGGVLASAVRLDEALQEPGDLLNYVYDYGDSWELTLRLEEVLPVQPGSPSAVVVAGARAAPPDDSGGGTDLASIARVVDDPAHVDLDQLNQALQAPYFLIRECDVDQRLVDLVHRLRYTDVGEDLARRVVALSTDPCEPDREEMITALTAYRWFLDRAKDGGIPLTTAGYLKPDDVEAASAVLPAMSDWIGKNNREINANPLLDFRESLQRMGLLRKYKGTLLLTRAGAAAQRDPARLWAHLAERLIPAKAGEFETVAALLVLAYGATTPGAPLPREQVASALAELGWRHRDGRLPQGYEIYRLDVFGVLVNTSATPAEPHDRNWVSPAAAALARAALQAQD